MFSMERGCSPSTRRPRTHSSRKPRLGSHLFFELEKANGLHTFHERDVLKETVPSKKEEIFAQRNRRNKELLANAPSYGYKALKGASKAGNGTANLTSKASHRRDRQRGHHDSDFECFQETRETSDEISEGNANGTPSVKQIDTLSNNRHPVNTKDLNQLARASHVEKASCKSGLLSRTQSHRRRVVPRKFYDDDTDKDRCVGKKDSGHTSRGQNYATNSCTKYNVELVPKSELGLPSNKKSNTKHLENKVLKKGSSFKADGIAYHSDEGAYLIREVEQRELLCVPEARRCQQNTYAQEVTLNGQDCEEESSEEDAVSGFNEQSTPELERSMRMTCRFGNQGASDVNERGELQVLTVRKSSRIPKKRIFDGDDEAPQRRQRKKLESESAVDHAEQEESTDVIANEYCERECLNSNEIAEPFLDEKKELPLTARQRALRISKEGGDPEVSISVGSPDELQPVLPKRQKENLTEAEQTIKKEEAARRRKQQMEKNAKEIQAVAIQKILGQESSRKKREEKLQKQRQEIEQVKQAAAMAPAVNSIRWVMGPSGNVVSFSQDVELPNIFSGPCSYPREREKCAGPSCNNVYKYRDSKTRLPLCSLQCYRAVQELPSTGPAF